MQITLLMYRRFNIDADVKFIDLANMKDKEMPRKGTSLSLYIHH